MTFREVKPALHFLGIFLGCYLGLSILYGLWIESRGDIADPMTKEVSREVVAILRGLSFDAHLEPNSTGPTVMIYQGSSKMLNMFEGCNGLNVMIVFVSFVLAFGGRRHSIFWFIPVGMFVIHLSNLGRIFLLYVIAGADARLFYYFHKYFFTAAIYVIVFVLWWLWIKRWNGISST